MFYWVNYCVLIVSGSKRSNCLDIYYCPDTWQNKVSASQEAAMMFLFLKRPFLDPSLLDSYCPVSDIPFLGKVEKIIKQQLQVLENKNNLDLFQSGFMSGYGMEPASVSYLLMTFGRVRMKMSLLDLCAFQYYQPQYSSLLLLLQGSRGGCMHSPSFVDQRAQHSHPWF